jgi:hypothetical protein
MEGMRPEHAAGAEVHLPAPEGRRSVGALTSIKAIARPRGQSVRNRRTKGSTMKYQLHAARGPSGPVATTDQPDSYLAEMWARAWVAAHATQGVYDLMEVDSGRTWELFRTHAGRWCLTSTTERPAA